jgi:hypothetical protein
VSMKSRFLALLGAALLPLACQSPSGTLLVEPIHVDSVEIVVQRSLPAQAVAHVRGVIGDGCSTLHSVRQNVSGNTIEVMILRQRPAGAICTQEAILYEDDIRLEGSFPPGTYVVRVNGVERTFTP